MIERIDRQSRKSQSLVYIYIYIHKGVRVTRASIHPSSFRVIGPCRRRFEDEKASFCVCVWIRLSERTDEALNVVCVCVRRRARDGDDDDDDDDDDASIEWWW